MTRTGPAEWSRAEKGAISRPTVRVLQQILEAWNADRADRGLKPLSADQALLWILEGIRDSVVAEKAE